MIDQNKASSPVEILIVDDHPNTATMLARVLSKFDRPVEIITASSGEDALGKIGNKMIDILITDFMMPGLNGLELIEKLKGAKKPAHTILMTAYDTPGLAITARRLNVQDYLVKPVQPEKIRGIVSKVISELRPADEIAGARMVKPAKILIADDYPDNLRLLSTRLKSEGYSFIPAWDGEETLVKVRSEEPDLVLLDVNMPKKDGFEVLAEMRADPDIAHIPVIIITAARIGPKDVREGLALGADDYITKPFDWRELAARIHSKLRVKQAEDVLRQRTRELGILPEIGQELSARLDIEELADIVVNRAVEALDVLSARLDIFNPDGSVYSRIRRAGEETPELLEVTSEGINKNQFLVQVISSRNGLIVEDVAVDKRWPSQDGNGFAGPAEGAVVSVPLLGRRAVIGILTLAHAQPAHFTQDHQALLQAIASQAAIAVENAQLLNVEHKRAQELLALNELGHEINQFSYTQELMDRLPRLIKDVLGYPVVALWDGVSQNDRELSLVSMYGASQDIDQDLFISVPQNVECGESSVLSSELEAPSSVIAVRLATLDKNYGVLAVYSPKAGAFQQSDLVLLETLSMQVLSALERISLFESVEKEQRRLLAVLRSAADAILVMDAQVGLTLANPAGEQLFKDAESRVGRPLPMGKGYDGLIALLDGVRESGAHQQGEVSWPDGRTFSVLVTPIEEGGQVAVLHDVSQFKALAELKNEYIATASHDLKNPIQAVLGFNDLLSKAGPLNEMQQDFSMRIRGSVQQMRDLVLNLLEVSRLESGALNSLEVLDLHALLEEIITGIHDQAQAKDHQLVVSYCDSQPFIEGDRTLFQQLVRNLLGNAIKYTPQNGEIRMTTELEDGQVIVRVEDTGVGIPADALPHIFKKFYRVQSDETRDIEGTGLGLAIVKSIAENHGGQVSVESVLDVGSTFIVRLPSYVVDTQ